MERERPEYLPPIEKARWAFPWLTVVGIAVLVPAILGVKQHLDTQAAWNQRFTRASATEKTPETPTIDVAKLEAQRAALIAETRLRRAVAEREAIKEREGWRFIDHTPFRKIDGGWENIPGESC
jgi:hypothetical protein